MTPADSVRGWRCKTSILPQFCASSDIFSCGVLPESGGVGTPAETLFTMGKGLKDSNFVTPDDSARNRKMRKIMPLNCSICLMPIFGVGKVYRIWTPKAVLPSSARGCLCHPSCLLWFHVFWRTFEAAGCVPSVMSQPRLPHAPTRGFGAPVFGLACYLK